MEPAHAIDFWDKPDLARQKCCTPILTKIRQDDGTITEFSDKQRVISVYCRVSTQSQKRGNTQDDDGGIGLRDQIKLALSLALEVCTREDAGFRIYTDAGFSGTYPPDDDALIREMRQTRAGIFRDVFREMVVLRCPENVRQDVENYSIMRYEKMLGEDEKPDDLTAGEGGLLYPAPPDKSYEAIEAALKRRFQNHQNYRKFRPALHFLMNDLPDIRAICVYDVDRLSRNYFLSVVLSERWRNAKVQIYAKTSDAGYLTGNSHVDRVMQAVFMGGAADLVPKNLRQIYRSHFAMLSQGHSPYTLPFYLDRDKRKQVIFNPRYLPVIEEMLKCWMDTENYLGTKVIAQKINQLRDAEGRPYPAPKNVHGLWTEPTVRFNMMNPLVYGCVSIWGREWPLVAGNQVSDYKSPLLNPETGEKVAPLALIAKSQWEKALRHRIRQHPHKHGRTVSKPQALTGLLKCRCGATLNFHTRALGYRSDHWTCHVERDVKNAIKENSGLVWHLGISNGDIYTFFCDLFQEAPHLLHSNASENYAELDAKYQALVIEREEARLHLADSARQKAISIFPENNPGYQGVYAAILKGLEGDETYQRLLRVFRELRSRNARRKQKNIEEKRQKSVTSPRSPRSDKTRFSNPMFTKSLLCPPLDTKICVRNPYL